MTIEGNMNPKMSEVDIVPDDDLNTRLKFYVSDQPDGTQSNSNSQELFQLLNFSVRTLWRTRKKLFSNCLPKRPRIWT